MSAREIDRFRRAEVLFDAALELPAGAERDAWLRKQCASDLELLAEIRRFLEYYAVMSTVPRPSEPLPQFGLWQAVRLLGRGGMGVVYLAERADGAFRMTAAVKVVPLALASLDIEERFRRERQFLASLEHPKIARLIDGGVTNAGLPYLVMEFVDGRNIERYCDTRQLDARSRIALVRQVLEALVYVHSRQVIHRDLKPSNILVDSGGNAKLLDFGTARLVDAGGDMAITKTGVFAFTPECASPEQVQGKPVTFAADVYATGVLLYRLLTGRAPYELSGHSAAAIVGTISHTEPAPSGLNAPLDAILRKALRKNPLERYATAGDMDADLARYLDGKPVEARRPRSKAWIAVAGALIAMALAAVAWFLLRPAAPLLPASIAVLPFTNVGGNPADQYFSDGLAAEITEALSGLKGLRVTPRSAAFRFRGKENDLGDMARQLGVTHVLEGSVERSGDRLTIVASLHRGSDGAQLWTNTYRRLTADSCAIEADLKSNILASLRITAPVQGRTHVPPEEAHEYYLKGRFESDQISMEANTLAQQYYQRAIELDPDYALAYDGLSGAIWNRQNADGEPFRPEEIKKSAQAAEKAIQLDPALARGHVALAMFAMRYDYDWNRAERELRIALSLGPYTGAELNYANLCLVLGRRQEADEHYQRARDLDSLSSQAVLNYEQYLTVEGRFAEADEEIRTIAVRSPTNERLRVRLNFLDAWMGSTDAMEKLRNSTRQRPYAREFLAEAEAHNGNREEVLRLLLPLEREYMEKHIAVYGLATIRAALNDVPNTVKLLDKAIDAREDWALYIPVDAAFAGMRKTPEFHRLKKRLGLDW